MSKRLPSGIIKDILTCNEHVESYTRNVGYDSFTNNFMLIEACLYNIQIMGEAVSQLPESVKEKEPQIPWALIKGMRNRLIHEYFGTDLLIVWNVIKDELPGFKIELNRIYQSLLLDKK